MSGSRALASLYLNPSRSGAAWLLDPNQPAVSAGLRAAGERRPADPCDPAALVADLDDLLVLLRERHFGLATGVLAAPVHDELDAWMRGWRERLVAHQPTTWGGALGTDFHDLRWLVRDAHLSAAGEDLTLVRATNPRTAEPVLGDDPGPCAQWTDHGGVLCVRLRSLDDSGGNDALLEQWRDAHAAHFAYDRIVVDLRGNGGGNDMYVYQWFADHAPAHTPVVASRTWKLGGEALMLWNAVVAMEATHGVDAVPAWIRDRRPTPDASVALVEEAGGAEDVVAHAGDTPWYGRMLVLTDRQTGSSGESAAWALQRVFGARLAGGRTAGCLRFGNITPYLLPRSGLLVRLGSKWNDHDDVEMIGLPVDVPLQSDTALATVAADFDLLHGA